MSLRNRIQKSDFDVYKMQEMKQMIISLLKNYHWLIYLQITESK